MKFGIVVNAYIRNDSQIAQANRIAEEFKAAGCNCEIVKNINLSEIICGKSERSDFDRCVFLDKDKATARLLEKSGVKLFNSADSIELCDDKFLTHIALANRGILMPDSISAPLCYYPDAEIPKEFLDEVADKLGFPLVAKKCFGSLGAGVSLINNMQELISYENTDKLTAHFYQRFIGCGGEDIRVIVIGGKYVCSMKRSNKNDFRSNVELGGRGQKFGADEELIELCERVTEILKLDYCGIDVLFDEQGKKYICEVNSNAFFAEAERVCGINIAKRYVDFIIASENA